MTSLENDSALDAQSCRVDEWICRQVMQLSQSQAISNGTRTRWLNIKGRDASTILLNHCTIGNDTVVENQCLTVLYSRLP
jgi:hypothetical protein